MYKKIQVCQEKIQDRLTNNRSCLEIIKHRYGCIEKIIIKIKVVQKKN